MANELKAKGNAAFSAKDFPEAIKFFTQAIELDPSNHVLYSNRSACHASLEDYSLALTDAEKCVELKPEWPKGYSRLGAAHFGLENWDSAVAAYEDGLKLDPENALLKSGLADAKRASTQPKQQSSPFGPQFLAKLATDPRTRSFLSQPDFLGLLQQVQRDPNNIGLFLKDPRMQVALSVGLGLNLATPEDTFGRGEEGSMEQDSPFPDAPRPSQPRPEPTPAPAPEPEPEPSREEAEAAKAKAAALKEKDLGNAAYKQKRFEEAIEHYNKALELYTDDISFLTNRAAVYFEMGEYEQCERDCEEAVERGKALRADYKLIARAMTRRGNALAKQDKLEEAIAVYNKALMEHRNADTLQRLNETEKVLKQRTEAAYIDLDLAAKEKDAGNAAFKEQRYPEAVKHYEESLKRGPPHTNPEAHKLYSNLSACFTKLGALNDALKAAERCIELAPTFAKGYSRKGGVQFFMKDYEKAIETYQAGLELEPDNQEIQAGIRGCVDAINRLASGLASKEEVKERQEKSMQDPEVQRILTDPVMRQVLSDFQDDPRAAQKHLRHPEIAAKIQKLATAGIIQIK